MYKRQTSHDHCTTFPLHSAGATATDGTNADVLSLSTYGDFYVAYR